MQAEAGCCCSRSTPAQLDCSPCLDQYYPARLTRALNRWCVQLRLPSFLLTFLCLFSILLKGGPRLLPPAQDSRDGAGQVESSVLLMRHCFRSTKEAGVKGVEGFKLFNDYSSEPWPEFSVPVDHCVPRGLEFLEAIGAWWREQQFHLSPSGPLGASSLPMPLRVIADAKDRDINSGKAFLRGFFGAEGPSGSFDVDHQPFSGSFGSSCPKFSHEEVAKEVAERLLAFPEEAEFPAIFSRMLELMGQGAAGDWTDSPCRIDESTGKLAGACSAAHSFAERFMMEWGAGQEFAWGRGKVSEVPEFLKVHNWYRNVQHGVPKLLARDQASIFPALLSELQSPHSGTTVFMGHDTQMNALATGFGLSWRPMPFPDSDMMPASAIHLRRIGDVVEAEYLYIPDPSVLSGELARVPATFESSGKASLPLTSFTHLAEAAYDPGCANPAPRQRPASLFSWDFVNGLVFT